MDDGRWTSPLVRRLSSIVHRPSSIVRRPSRDSDAPVVDGELIGKLDRLSLGVGRELIDGLMGEHLAQRRTAGIEFADYRQYSPGDDLRRVDWNAYARLGSLHVRQAQAEHDTALYLLVDASPSMDTGAPSKFYSARRLAASLGYIALSHLDAVVLNAPGGRGFGAATGPETSYHSKVESGSLFRQLQEMRTGTIAQFDDILVGWSTGREGARTGRMAVLISDLLLDRYRDGVRRLVSAGFQVTVLHMLSPEELRPPDMGDLELIDSETNERMEIHLGTEAAAEYRRRLDGWLAETEDWCRGQGAGYFLVQSDWDVERVLLESLRRRGVTA
jgi:uncharacterized protein (DUF58 family)